MKTSIELKEFRNKLRLILQVVKQKANTLLGLIGKKIDVRFFLVLHKFVLTLLLPLVASPLHRSLNGKVNVFSDTVRQEKLGLEIFKLLW